MLADGTVLVAWRDDGPAGDGAGTSVRARIYAADGTPGTPFVASSTIAGDQGLPQLISSATFFAMLFRDGTGARVRLFSDAGDPLPNRDAPPTTGDFPIGATITTNGDDLAIAAGGPAGSAQFMTVWAEGGDIRGRLFPFP